MPIATLPFVSMDEGTKNPETTISWSIGIQKCVAIPTDIVRWSMDLFGRCIIAQTNSHRAKAFCQRCKHSAQLFYALLPLRAIIVVSSQLNKLLSFMDSVIAQFRRRSLLSAPHNFWLHWWERRLNGCYSSWLNIRRMRHCDVRSNVFTLQKLAALQPASQPIIHHKLWVLLLSTVEWFNQINWLVANDSWTMSPKTIVTWPMKARVHIFPQPHRSNNLLEYFRNI